MGRDERPWEFFDIGTGEVHGLNIDLLREACDIAGKRCEFVAFKNYEICWDDDTGLSRGLSNRYFDGCAGYMRTIKRDLTYGHSVPYAGEAPYFLWARKGSNIQFDSVKRTNNYMISHRANFAWGDLCLQANIPALTASNFKGFDTYAAQRDQLSNGQTDLAFLPASEAHTDFVQVSPQLKCTMGGRGIMARKDNAPLFEWLNPALEMLIGTKNYERACYIGKKAYGGPPFCFEG